MFKQSQINKVNRNFQTSAQSNAELRKENSTTKRNTSFVVTHCHIAV